MAVAQRLVRKVCKECATYEKPSEKMLSEIKKGLKNLPSSVKIPYLDKIKIAKVKEGGCATCNFTGYKGRQGLFEAFLVDTDIEKFILTNPPVSSIREMAIKKGMITMYQSGLIDVALGKTTMEEVLRVVEAEEEKASVAEAEKI
jgi:type II secretory ATPase GspE/PulE/Tfp pilus assembly ATPase PilB-like protein